MDNEEFAAFVTRVRRNMRITKVVATRAVKTSRGDFFAGFAAGWDAVQDDAGGPGADMDLTMEGSDITVSAMTLKEAVVAHAILAMQVDLAAYRAALANAAITPEEFKAAEVAVTRNYEKTMRVALKAEP